MGGARGGARGEAPGSTPEELEVIKASKTCCVAVLKLPKWAQIPTNSDETEGNSRINDPLVWKSDA